MACLSSSKRFTLQPILAECMVLWRAIEFCEDLGLPSIQLEGDAQTIINAVISEDNCQAWYGGIVEDVKAMLRQRTNWSINFVHHGSN